ncbi:hypothetical protein [Psychrobacter fjordensis]
MAVDDAYTVEEDGKRP